MRNRLHGSLFACVLRRFERATLPPTRAVRAPEPPGPPNMRRRHPHGQLLSLLLATASILGCESPTQPSDPSALAFGRAVTGHLASGESRTFHVDAKAGQSFAAFVQASGDVALSLRDPSDQQVGATLATAGDTATMRYGVATKASADGRFTIVVSSGSQATGGDFNVRAELINTAPEHVPQTVSLGAVVTGERIDFSFDQDQFIIDVPAATDVELYLHADGQSQSSLTPLGVSLWRDGETSAVYDKFVYVPTGAPDLQQWASGRLTLAAGRYILAFGGAYGAAYTFQLQPVNRAPEHAAATLTLGDTISESIDYVGDVDDFVLRGTPGAEYEVFVAATGAAPHEVNVRFPDLDASGPARAFTILGEPLLDAPTGRVTMPASGQLTVRVTDAGDQGGLFRGPYRLVAVAIDRRPEGRSDTIVPSDSVIASALEIYGDVDEYRFTLDAPKRLALRCAPTPLGGCSAIGAALYSDATPDKSVSLDGHSPLPAGAYRLRLESHPGAGGPSTAHGMYRGPYQFVLAAVDTMPEDGPAALTIGTPVTESITWPRDIDTFTFDVPAADTVVVHLAMTNAVGSSYRIDVRDALTGAGIDTTEYGALPTDRRIDLVAGHYAVTLSAAAGTWTPGARGSYELTVQRASAAPEGRGAAVTFGDTVRSVFDYKGDIDDYVLTGTPGDMAYVTLLPEHPLWDGRQFFAVALQDPATGSTLAYPWTPGYRIVGVPVEIPAGGTLRLRVCVLQGCLRDYVQPPYTFVVNHVNRAPESRAATFAVGDTVADAIEQPQDVDDFTFAGTAGQTIDVVALQAPNPPYGSNDIYLVIVDDGTGAQLAKLPLRGADVQAGTDALRGLVLPHTGRYRVRVHGETTGMSLTTTGAYRFVVAPH
jgi:hypothetical protein